MPSMTRFTSKGSIDGSIILDIIKTIDILGVHDSERAQGIKPMLLLDAHSSRFDVQFLEYIDTPATEWVVCIVVPYDTSLW